MLPDHSLPGLGVSHGVLPLYQWGEVVVCEVRVELGPPARLGLHAAQQWCEREDLLRPRELLHHLEDLGHVLLADLVVVVGVLQVEVHGHHLDVVLL